MCTIYNYIFIQNDGSCYSLMPLIHAGCSDLHEFEGSCYEGIQEFSVQPRSYIDARRYCEENGGHLLYIETMDELDYINTQLDRGYSYWIGLTVVYRWMDGSPASYQSFELYKRDGSNECFLMKSYNFNWYGNRCNNEHGYICEQRNAVPIANQTFDGR